MLHFLISFQIRLVKMISTKILWAFIIFCDILTQFCCCHQIGGFSVNLIVNKKASGEITEALTAESLLQCAQRCLRRKKCNAINYANLMTDEANCELQRVTFGEEKFEHSKEWGYSYLFYLETTGTVWYSLLFISD